MMASPALPHDNKSPWVIAAMVPLILATLLCVSARFYARWILRRSLGLDDGIMLISALFGLSFDAAVFIMVKNGLGLHAWDFHIPMIEAVLKLRVANNCLYIATSFLTKISLCLTYLRLFPDHKSNAWFCRVAITVCAAAGLALLVAQLLYCRPLSDFWDLLKPTKRNCFPAYRYDYSAKGLNALANLFVFIWPARFIWGLKLPTSKRVTLVAVFCMGCCIAIVSIVAVCLNHLHDHGGADAGDPTAGWASQQLFMAAELNVGIVCICLPFCRPALVLIFPCLFSKPAARPPILPKFSAFSAPSARRPALNGFANITLLAANNEPNQAPAIAPRVLQTPPNIDIIATLRLGHIVPASSPQAQAHRNPEDPYQTF